jgi:hypothetical protein
MKTLIMYRRWGLSRGPSVIWDLCPSPVGQGNRSKIMEGPVLRSFPYVEQSWIFSLFRNSDRLAGTFHRRRSQYCLAGTFHRRRSHLLKTGIFRQGGENTKGKSRHCFSVWSSPCRCLRPYWRPPFLMGHLLGWVHRNGPTCAPSIRSMWILSCGWTTIRSYVERPYYLGRFWVQ